MAGGTGRNTWSWARGAGVGLLVLAAVVLFLPDRVFQAFGVLVFVGLLLPGVFLATGLWGTPAEVVRRRQEGAAPARAGDREPVEVVPRVFEYHFSKFAQAILTLMAAAFLIGGLALFLLLWRDPRLGLGSALATGGFLFAFGLLVLLYQRRWTQIRIEVDSTGIKAQSLFTRVAMSWQDVIALKHFGVPGIGVGMIGRVYRVYSSTQTLEFYDSLTGAPELVTIIAAATAQTWE